MSVQVKGSGTIGGLDEGLVVSGIVTSSTQINVGSNIKLGNAGVVTATSFVGSGANLTSLPTQVTISNNANNRVITGGSGVNLNGESNLTFDGTNLLLGGSTFYIKNAMSDSNGLKISQESSDESRIFNHYSGPLTIGTANLERLRITSTGEVSIGGNSSVGTKVHVENSSGDAHIRLRGSANYGVLFSRHSDGALTGYVGSGNAVNLGGSDVALSAPLSGGNIKFQTNGTAATDEKMRINSSGHVTIGNNYGQTSRKLFVETTHASGGEVVYFGNSNGGNYGGLVLSAGENNGECRFNSAWGNSYFTFYTQDSGGAAERLKIEKDGNIWQALGTKYAQRGYFRTDTNQQNASNAATLAGALGYGFGYQEAYGTSGGGWSHPYPDLVLGFHTGISMGAYPNYGGIRFFNDHPSSSSTMIMSIGNGGNGVVVTNSLSKGGGSFRIAHPHPSKKYTHDLVHSFIEGPQMDLIYRGKIDLVGGSATVNIDTKANMTDGTFVLLNRDVQCFTSNETGWTAVKGSVSGNILTITAQDNSCTDTISWMVVGERQDDKIKSLDMTDDNGDLITEPLTIEETHM